MRSRFCGRRDAPGWLSRRRRPAQPAASRALGFIAASQEGSFPVLHEALGATSYETGLALGTALLARRDPPDGVFCTTDLMACGMLDAARHRFGLRVPEDLSVIGIDDIAQAAWEAYQLTTFAQPIDAIASASLDWLTSLPSEDRSSVVVRLPARLVWRGSVRTPRS